MSLPDQPARHPQLEAAIRANRDDLAAYSVYADFLQSRGNSVGELLVYADRDPQRAKAIIAKLDLPPANLATFGWRHGLWQWLRLENSNDWMNNDFDALELARPLFGAIPCCALEELRIGVLRWESNYDDVPAVLAEAATHDWARDLARLHLGDVSEDIDMTHHAIGDVGPVITRAFPRLSSLKLHGADQSWSEGAGETLGVGGLVLPELRELVLETCSLSSARLVALLAAELPKLERLELWFGSDDEGADATLDDLEPLLSGRVFPTVRHLGLRNAEITNELARTLPRTAIAARLESLDLSMGTLEDEAALELVIHANKLPALKRLSVDDNFLTARSLDSLRNVWRDRLISEGQKAIEGDWRYVTVSE